MSVFSSFSLEVMSPDKLWKSTPLTGSCLIWCLAGSKTKGMDYLEDHPIWHVWGVQIPSQEV